MDVSDAVGLKPVGSPSLSRHQGSKQRTDYSKLKTRLESFRKFKGSVDARELASNGFVYLEEDDSVVCYVCDAALYKWFKDNMPKDIQKQHLPSCSFGEDGDLVKGFDSASGETGKGYQAEKAMYPAYVQIRKRHNSFSVWPVKNKVHTARNMSVAGFFYVGSADRARCFYCGVTLRDWSLEDDPFSVHMQWSPKCDYIKHIVQQPGFKRTSSDDSLEKKDSEFASLRLLHEKPQTHQAENISVQKIVSEAFKKNVALLTDGEVERSRDDIVNNCTFISDFRKSSALGVAGAATATGAAKEAGAAAGITSSQGWEYPTYVQAVLEMGCSIEDVEKAIQRKKLQGKYYSDAVTLFTDIEYSQ